MKQHTKMPITSVTYQRAYVTGAFLQEKIGVEITLEENQDPLEALAEAKKLTDSFHMEANPHLHTTTIVYPNGMPSFDEEESRPFFTSTIPEQLPTIDISQEREAITIENASTMEELATLKPTLNKALMPAYMKRLKQLTNSTHISKKQP